MQHILKLPGRVAKSLAKFREFIESDDSISSHDWAPKFESKRRRYRALCFEGAAAHAAQENSLNILGNKRLLFAFIGMAVAGLLLAAALRLTFGH